MLYSAADLPDTLAVFPLPDALLLPRARLPLHIFEPRYLAMFDDVLKTPGRLIGLIQPVEGDDNGRLRDTGCAGRITSFTETDDGRYMVTLTGVSRFKAGPPVEGFTPYHRCPVSWDGFAHDLNKAERDPGLERQGFLDLLGRYFDLVELQTDWDNLNEAEDELLINSLAMLCPFEAGEKQALLEARTLAQRREVLVTLMEFALRGGAREERLQ